MLSPLCVTRKAVQKMAMNEGAEMRYMDNPITLCREYMFRVCIPKTMLLNKYVAFWHIVKYMWKVVRNGK